MKETSAMEKVDNQYPLVLSSFLHNLHNQGIFLDGKLADLVEIMIVKLVPAQPGICGFEVIQRAQFLQFSIEEELLCATQSCD